MFFWRTLWIFQMVLVFFPFAVYAQSMEGRVKALEDYVETFQPTLLELSASLQAEMETTKAEVSRTLHAIEASTIQRVEEKIQTLDTRRILLDANSRSFQSIQTNVGLLLVSVEALREGPNGLQLVLNIGNPIYADIQGFKVRLLWGPKHYPALEDYAAWRQSLKGAEYTFDGMLVKGRWNQVAIELGDVEASQLAYMECELEALSVQLQF